MITREIYQYKELVQALETATSKEEEILWYKIILDKIRIVSGTTRYKSEYFLEHHSPEWYRKKDLEEMSTWLRLRNVGKLERPTLVLDKNRRHESVKFAYKPAHFTYLSCGGRFFSKEKERIAKTKKLVMRLEALRRSESIMFALVELANFVNTPYQAIALFWWLKDVESTFGRTSIARVFRQTREYILFAQLKTFDDYQTFLLSAVRKSHSKKLRYLPHHLRYPSVTYQVMDLAQDTARSISDKLSVAWLNGWIYADRDGFAEERVFSYLKENVCPQIRKRTVEEYIALFVSEKLWEERCNEILSGE